MADLFLSRLPVPFPRILEIGADIGLAFSPLDGKSCQVHRIPIDAIRVDDVREGRDDPVAPCQHLAEFDAVLFHESVQYIEPLVIFNKALDSLSSDGRLLIVGKSRLVGDGGEGDDWFDWFDELVALAGRFGFELVERLNLQQETLKVLDEAACHDERVSGRHGLLHFRKKSVPRWRLRLLEERHADEMMALFQRVFGHRMAPEMLCWKYGEGRGAAIGVWEDNQMVAHYGGVGREIHYFGQPSLAVQNCDVMVDRSGRGSLTRQGPLFLAVATFLERSVGYGKMHLLGFGFPSERAWKAPYRLGLYGGPVGRMFELAWRPARRRGALKTSVKEIDLPDEIHAGVIADCWATMAQDLKDFIVGVRDTKYLVHRYSRHPEKSYRCFVVRQRITRKPLGIFVLHQLDNAGSYELVDMLGSRRVCADLVFQARRVVAILGGARLVCWAADSIISFLGKDAETTDLGINIPTNVWTRGPAVEEVAGHWWLMGGDVDFR